MKRFLALVFSVFLFTGTTGVCGAAYIDIKEDLDLYTDQGGPVIWEHSLSFEGSECESCATIGLTIWADDVDQYFEIDEVWIYQGESLGIKMGVLDHYDYEGKTYDTPGPDEEQGLGGNKVSETFLSIDCAEYEFVLDPTQSLVVRVEDIKGDYARFEIEKSMLEVQCTPIPVPSALLLLGSGVFGLLGVRKIFVKK